LGLDRGGQEKPKEKHAVFHVRDPSPPPSQLSSRAAMGKESDVTRVFFYYFFILIVLTFYGGQV